MIKQKQSLIKKQGNSVEVTYDGITVPTFALVGRATKQFNSTLSLESNRRGYFLPTVAVSSGAIVRDLTVGDKYIVAGSYREIIDRQVCSTVAHMLVCNTAMTVRVDGETADENGNIIRSSRLVMDNVPVYVETANSELRQIDPGLHVDTEYVIYAPSLGILEVLDRVFLASNGREIPLKVISADYVTFPGLARIQVRSETRR